MAGKTAQGSSNGAGAREGCALVTGAGRGIGAAIAVGLAADGWPVVVNYRADEEGARGVVSRIEEAGGRATAIQGDVASSEDVERTFGELEEAYGPALVVVNNAGIRHDRLTAGLSVEDWRRVVDVNLHGTFHTINRALGKMVRNRFGRIVNISTISAARPLPGQSAYAASKAGVEALTRAVSIEVARRGVTVNAIEPGLVATDFVPELTEEWAQAVPAKRWAEPEEIAALVRFLASEEASFITGAVIPMDGGMTAGLGTFGRPAGNRETAVTQ
ncbi:MAG TPA: SDR family NAD(P)-dependent oxidoreductase [Thermoleophilaceae bacterium]|jgi:3-oxoacyl-[acyl-carrier protein] reductase